MPSFNLFRSLLFMIPVLRHPFLANAFRHPSPVRDNTGLWINTEYCARTSIHGIQIDQTAKLLDAIKDTEDLVNAGIAALDYPGDQPFKYFFRPEDATVVNTTLHNLLEFLEHPENLKGNVGVEINCDDDEYCEGSDPPWGATKSLTTASTANHPSWGVTLCNRTLDELERNPRPCTPSTIPRMEPGFPSLAWAMVRQLVQMWFIGEIGDNVRGPKACNALVNKAGGDPKGNAESYAYFASMAYDLGYLANTCLKKWRDDPEAILPPWARTGITGSGSITAR